MKSKQFRITQPSENADLIESLAGQSGQQFTDVAGMLLSAAVQAVRENGGKFIYPPKFYIDQSGPRYELNEPKGKR